MKTLRSESDINKCKGGKFIAFVCEDCQSRAGLSRISDGSKLQNQCECQCCGHLRYGTDCVCELGDWLSVKPNEHSRVKITAAAKQGMENCN